MLGESRTRSNQRIQNGTSCCNHSVVSYHLVIELFFCRIKWSTMFYKTLSNKSIMVHSRTPFATFFIPDCVVLLLKGCLPYHMFLDSSLWPYPFDLTILYVNSL